MGTAGRLSRALFSFWLPAGSPEQLRSLIDLMRAAQIRLIARLDMNAGFASSRVACGWWRGVEVLAGLDVRQQGFPSGLSDRRMLYRLPIYAIPRASLRALAARLGGECLGTVPKFGAHLN